MEQAKLRVTCILGWRRGRKLACLLILHVLFLERSIEFETGCSNSHHRPSWQNPTVVCHVPPCRTCNLQRASQCHQFRAIDVVISLWRIILLAKFPPPAKLVTQRTCKVWILENRRKHDRKRRERGGTNAKSRLGESLNERTNEREKRRSSRPTSNHNLALCRVVCRVGRSG